MSEIETIIQLKKEIDVDDIFIELNQIEIESQFKIKEREKLQQVVLANDFSTQNNIAIQNHIKSFQSIINKSNYEWVFDNLSLIDKIESLHFYDTKNKYPDLYSSLSLSPSLSVLNNKNMILIHYDKIGVPYSEHIHCLNIWEIYEKVLKILEYLNKTMDICVYDFSLKHLNITYKMGHYIPILYDFSHSFIRSSFTLDDNMNNLEYFLDNVSLIGKPFEVWIIKELYMGSYDFLSITIIEKVFEQYLYSFETYLPLWNWREKLHCESSVIYKKMVGFINCHKKEVIGHFWSPEYQQCWDVFSLQFMIGHIISFGFRNNTDIDTDAYNKDEKIEIYKNWFQSHLFHNVGR